MLGAFTSLNGTQMNCSGGRCRGAAWITCEETVNGPDVGPDFTGVSNVPLTSATASSSRCPPAAQSDREPITAAGPLRPRGGRLRPRATASLYLTEDNFGFPSGFYRYIPAAQPDATPGGSATAAGCRCSPSRASPNADLAAAQPARRRYRVAWVDIDDPAPTFPYTPGEPAPTTNDTALTYVGNQGRAQGAARFSRLEGAVYDRGHHLLHLDPGRRPGRAGPQRHGAAATATAPGQIWAYHTRSERLRLIYQSPGPDTLDFPDNVTTSKRGTLVLCEDNVNDNFLRGLTRQRAAVRHRPQPAGQQHGRRRFNDEFAGSTFSPTATRCSSTSRPAAG